MEAPGGGDDFAEEVGQKNVFYTLIQYKGHNSKLNFFDDVQFTNFIFPYLHFT